MVLLGNVFTNRPELIVKLFFFSVKGASNIRHNEETTKPAKVEVNNRDDMTKLSRQQWKNKMKNKRKCKNKFRQNESEEAIKTSDKQGPRIEMDLIIKKTNGEKFTQTKKKDKECNQQRRKEDPDTETLREAKQQVENQNKTKNGRLEKAPTKPCADGSKQKAGEPKVKVTDDQQQSVIRRLKPELSKKQSQKRDKLLRMLHSQNTDQRDGAAEPSSGPAAPEEESKQDRSASLRSRMEQRLESARFRYINEVLYSTSSGEATRMFRQDPQAFWVYHRGYTAQVQRWPANPVDTIISYIQQK